jgi:hypothetical protein
MTTPSNNTLSAALAYIDAGLSILPTAKDKLPALKAWKDRQTSIPAKDIIKREFSGNGNCVAIICGKVSGNTETLDFDQQGKCYDQYARIVGAEEPGLLDRLVSERNGVGPR